jgi:hypothetical protein
VDNESRAPKGNGSRVDPARRHREPKQNRPSTQSPKLSRSAKWQAANPLAVWSHVAVQSALRRGLIQRQPCSVCGSEPADAHHADYMKPLEITWLCRFHHKAEHRRMGAKHGPR